jgi:hypothetical protein
MVDDRDFSSEIEAEAMALSLRGDQAIADLVAHSVDNQARILVANNIDALDRYRAGDVAAYIRLHFRGVNREFCLSFYRVPSCSESAVVSPKRDVALEFNSWSTEKQRDEGAVFLGVSNLVESPKGIIPSWVSLEPLKNRTDFRWQILAPTLQVISPMVFGGAERELDGLEGGAFSGDRRSVAGLIQDRSQVIGDVEEQTGQSLWYLAHELDFVRVLAGVRLRISQEGPCLLLDKSVNDGLELLDVVLCAPEREMRAVEHVRHGGQTHPNQSPGILEGGAPLPERATAAA